MSFQINRRSFLLSLIALGASYVLPVNATPDEVDEVWEEAKARPWYFEVNEWDTITDPDCAPAKTWGDVFESLGTGHLQTAADVVGAVHTCQPLINHFQGLASDELDELERELDGDPPPRLLRRRHLEKVVRALRSDPDGGWHDWIILEGEAGVPRFREAIDAWLAQPPDHRQSEWFPLSYGSQGQAKAFFERLDDDTLDALGVVIIEGEHPGSSYYAAELRQDVDEANAMAQELDLPFRFRRG